MGDGLDNYFEYTNGLFAGDPDTDNDGFKDGVEVRWGMDPLTPLPIEERTSDYDNDQLILYDEVTYLDTDPNDPDTDDDGLIDGYDPSPLYWGIEPPDIWGNPPPPTDTNTLLSAFVKDTRYGERYKMGLCAYQDSNIPRRFLSEVYQCDGKTRTTAASYLTSGARYTVDPLYNGLDYGFQGTPTFTYGLFEIVYSDAGQAINEADPYYGPYSYADFFYAHGDAGSPTYRSGDGWTSQLSDEYTTAMMIQDAIDNCPPYESRFRHANNIVYGWQDDTADYGVSDNETFVDFCNMKYKFVFNRPVEDKGVYWREAFYPDDDSATRYTYFSETVDGTETAAYEIDAFDEGEEGTYYVQQLICNLTPDFNRDGEIDTQDQIRVDSNEVYRFWVNDDNDDPNSEVSGDDFPGMGLTSSTDQDWHNTTVDGMRDLIDFFAVKLEVDDTLLDSTLFSYHLKNEDAALNFAYTDMSYYAPDSYLHSPTTAQALSSTNCYPITAAGTELTGVVFKRDYSANENYALVLIEGRDLGTTKPLIFEVRHKTSGQVVSSAKLDLSINGVQMMYRFKSLRGDKVDVLVEPPNYPDVLTSEKDFVFVHGYNVSAVAGDATHAEVFKRMHQSGYQGKFWGVSWYGDPPALANAHYHNSVIEAFSAAHGLRAFLESDNFDSPPDLAAHSLGNGVVGIALNDAMNSATLIRNYFALDAAMSLEAYGEISTEPDMEPMAASGHNIFAQWPIPPYFSASWENYPDIDKSSEWHTLFDASDHRSELTWRNRLSNTISRVENAYNFYSSTEEVLRVDNGCTSFLSTTPSPIGAGTGYYAWQIQECYKGQKLYWQGTFPNFLPDLMAGGSSLQAGWQFTLDRNSMHVTVPLSGPAVVAPSVEHQWLADDPIAYKTALKTDPLFNHEPAILFSTNGSVFVNGVVTDYESELNDYMPANSVVPVKCRDWLLAKAFPARSRPMGSTENTDDTVWQNFDMAQE